MIEVNRREAVAIGGGVLIGSADSVPIAPGGGSWDVVRPSEPGYYYLPYEPVLPPATC